jgi:RNA-directed DNA polymerase
MSLAPPETVRKLQEALHTKAKKAPSYRFYALFDKMYRADVLSHAYERCRDNDGAAGVDGQKFEDIEKAGPKAWLDALAKELRQKTYQPQAVRRVWIPKADGKQRPLGIPTVRDRVVQMAALLVLEPIFEADLQPEQYGYRAGRSALDALTQVKELVRSGHTEVVDADLSGYFDSIPHAELLRCLARRISDGRMMALLARWLEMPVEETDGKGNRHRTTRNKDEGKGTPQGAPLSPLLANLYMRRFILGWKTQGHEQRLQARIVNYADDFVICCRHSAKEAMAVMRSMMARLKLTVNEAKTRLCRVPSDTFDFLGYSIGERKSPRTGGRYLTVWPSAKTVKALCTAISEQTRRCWAWLTQQELIERLNQKIVGWANYFRLGTVSAAYQRVRLHACHRFRQWLGRKTGKRVWAARCQDQYLHATLGLIDPAKVRKAYALSCANV